MMRGRIRVSYLRARAGHSRLGSCMYTAGCTSSDNCCDWCSCLLHRAALSKLGAGVGRAAMLTAWPITLGLNRSTSCCDSSLCLQMANLRMC